MSDLRPSPMSAQPADDPAAISRDAEWMRRIREGDLDAMQGLVEEHQVRVLGTITKMLGDPTEAEDLAQQVFIRVWKAAHSYRADARFTTWLMTITRNLVFNEMRRRKRKPFLSTEAAQEHGGLRFEAAAASRSPAADLMDRELEQAVGDAIAALPDQQRMAVILRRYEDFSYEEIASVLGVSTASVKSLLFRARAALREHLAKYLV